MALDSDSIPATDGFIYGSTDLRKGYARREGQEAKGIAVLEYESTSFPYIMLSCLPAKQAVDSMEKQSTTDGLNAETTTAGNVDIGQVIESNASPKEEKKVLRKLDLVYALSAI